MPTLDLSQLEHLLYKNRKLRDEDGEKPPAKPQKVEPFPAVLYTAKGKEWSLEESTPYNSRFDRDTHTMYAPLGDSVLEEFIRFQQMGRIEFSPTKQRTGKYYNHYCGPEPKLERIPDDLIRNCERARVDKLIAANSDHFIELLGEAELPLWLEEFVYRVNSSEDPAFEFIKTVAEYACHQQKLIKIAQVADAFIPLKREGIEGVLFAAFQGASFILDQDPKSAVRFADLLMNQHSYMQWVMDGEPNYDPEGDPFPCEEDLDGEWESPSLEKEFEAQVQKRPPIYKHTAKLWGKMKIEYPDRPLTARQLRLGRGSRRDLTGVVPRYPHRIITDRKMFAKRKRMFGGAILIDGSGSMGTTAQMLIDLVEQAPAAVVAVYNGNGNMGKLKILARNGKRVEDQELEPEFHGNIVDGPALSWLSEQARPRIWISDGWVTGPDDVPSTELKIEAAQLVHRYKIKQVPSHEAALTYLEKVRETSRT